MTNIIINADDFGISHNVNLAIRYCFQKGLINQTTLMVNMPHMEEAVGFAVDCHFDNCVGLHLNLVEGVPLTEEIRYTSLCNSDGLFNGSIMSNKINRFILTPKVQKCVRNEMEAQIKAFLNMGIGIKHIDSHQHSHTNPSVFALLEPLIVKYEFESIRLSRNIPREQISGVKRLYKNMYNSRLSQYNQAHNSHNIVYFGSLKDANIEGLLKAPTELMVHPIMDDDKLKDAVGDILLTSWWRLNGDKYNLL